MTEGDSTNPIDAAAEITDAMMSSLADVVKTVIANPEHSEIREEQEKESSSESDTESEKNSEDIVIDTTVEDLVSEGEAAHRSGDHDAALKAFNKAIALDPSNPMAWFNRGVLLEAEQDSRGARQAFVICLDLDPNHGPALANLAVLLDRLGEPDGALEIADRALKYFPGHPHLVKIMEHNKAAGGVLHTTPTVMPHTQDKLVDQTLTHVVDTGIDDLLDDEESKTELSDEFEDELLETNQEDIENIIEEETVEDTIIEEDEPEAINIDELCAEAKSKLGQGDAKAALQILKEHLHTIAAKHFESWQIAAGAMAAMGLDDHAISAYTHAIGLESTNAKCYFNLGALHERKGNTEAAMKCFVSAIEHDSSYNKAASRLAAVAENTRDIANLLLARRVLANEPEGRENLATLLIELAEGEANVLDNTGGLPPTIPEGPTLAAEAVDLCQENTMLMGRALSAAGKHTDSVKTWKAMIQNDKNNPEYWTGLGRALEAAGDMATAQRCHQKANMLANPEPLPQDPLDNFVQEQEAISNDIKPTETTVVTQPVPTPSAPPMENQQSSSTFVTQPVPTPSPPTSVVSESSGTVVNQPVPTPIPPSVNVSIPAEPLPDLTVRPEPTKVVTQPNPEVDLAAAALDAAARVSVNTGMDSNSNSIANQDIEWYNKGVGLIEDKKYREALSCFDRALPSFADNDEMVIRILNGRGNALYYLEDYPKCVESYHKAMVINPKGVQGKTLYNMGTAYAEMQRFGDAIKCFEQAMPRGLDKNQQKLAKEQIRRCNILQKEQQRKMG